MQYDIVTPYGKLDVTDYFPELKFSFEDLQDYSAGLASYSGELPLPGTENNRRFFRQYYDLTATTEFDANRKVPATIYADSNQIFTGYLKLQAVEMMDSEPTFRVAFVESTRDFSDAIRDTYLKDLDWTDCNHVRSIAAITASWTAPLGEGYVYPKEITGRYDDAATTFTWQWNPATYVKTAWDKTFAAAGYTYSSEFLQSEYFRRLIIPYGQAAIEMTEDQIMAQTVRAGVSGSLPAAQSGSTLPETFNAANDGAVVGSWLNKYGIPLGDTTTLDFTNGKAQWNNDTFTVAESGFYDIDFHAPFAFKYTNPTYNTFYLDSGELLFHWEMILYKQGGTGVLIADSGRTQTNPYGLQTFIPVGNRNRNTIYTNENFAIDLAASNVWMDPGDQIKVKLSFSHPEDNVWKDSGGIGGIVVNVYPMILRNIGTDFTYFSAKPSSNVMMSDEEIRFNQCVPAMKCVDFVADIKTMFNLVFRQDPQNATNILVEPYDVYMDSLKATRNWDEKLDHSAYENLATATEIAQTYRYTYQEDADYFNRRYQENTTEVYGTQTWTTTNDINTDTEEIAVGFAATPVASAFDATQFIQPWYVDIQTSTDTTDGIQPEAVSAKPRILFYGGLIATTDYRILANANDVGATFTAYPYCGHWDNPTDPQWDLNWGLVQSVNWPTTRSAGKTLFNQFHRNALLNRVAPDSRILKGAFRLSAKDIAELDPRDRIWIAGSYWRVLTVDWIDETRLSPATLLRVLDNGESTRTTFAVPDTTTACPSDLVAVKDLRNNWWYYASTSGQHVTQGCCESLAGTWTNGVCVVPQASPPKPSNPGTTPNTPAAISVDKNQIVAQRGATGKSSGVTTRGSFNLASSVTRNASVFGSGNVLNNNSDIIVIGNDNALNNVFESVFIGDSNTVAEPDINLPSDSTRALVFGDANTITPGTSLVTILGSNITADTSSTTYIQNLKMSGNIEASGIIHGTASYALNSPGGGGTAISASYSATASIATSASYADKALHAENILMYVQNNTGATIPKGKVVIISGSVGDNPLVRLADYTTERMSAYTVGFTYESIANGGQGRILTEGRLVGIDTSGYTGGDLLYLGASGSFTNVEPTPPNHTVRLGQILRVQQNNGVIDVRIDNGYELDELHDVRIVNPTEGQVLTRSGSVWVNATPASAVDPVIVNRIPGNDWLYAVTCSAQVSLFPAGQVFSYTAPNVKIIDSTPTGLTVISASFATAEVVLGAVFAGAQRQRLTHIDIPNVQFVSASMFNALPAASSPSSGSLRINSAATASIGWSASKAVMDTKGWTVRYVNSAPST